MLCGGSSRAWASRITAAALVLWLSSCAMPAGRDNPSYQAGFGDGCASASAAESAIPRAPQRNEALYASDADYRAGWISGRDACRMQGGAPRL